MSPLVPASRSLVLSQKGIGDVKDVSWVKIVKWFKWREEGGVYDVKTGPSSVSVYDSRCDDTFIGFGYSISGACRTIFPQKPRPRHNVLSKVTTRGRWWVSGSTRLDSYGNDTPRPWKEEEPVRNYLQIKLKHNLYLWKLKTWIRGSRLYWQRMSLHCYSGVFHPSPYLYPFNFPVVRGGRDYTKLYSEGMKKKKIVDFDWGLIDVDYFMFR